MGNKIEMDTIKASLIMLLPSLMECEDKKTRDTVYDRYFDMIEDLQDLSLTIHLLSTTSMITNFNSSLKGIINPVLKVDGLVI